MKSDRTRSESVTLWVCVALLTLVVGLILWQMPNEDSRPAPVASSEGVERVGDEFHLTVLVTNLGGRTASNVQVNAELVVDGEATEGDQVIDFLAPGVESKVAFVFDDDPESGDLTVAVGSYTIP